MELVGGTVLVTGATRGIGRELTHQFLALGTRVVAVGRDRGRLEQLARVYSRGVWPWTVDLGEPEAVDGLIRDLPDRHPDLAVVVNNAAIQTPTDFLTSEPDVLRPVLRREIATNLDAVVALSTGLLPLLRRQPAAAIVNITSALALAPKRSAPVYCATKAGVRAFTRALRYQCRDAAPHVRVLDVMMPLVDTEMTRARQDQLGRRGVGSGRCDPSRLGRGPRRQGQDPAGTHANTAGARPPESARQLIVATPRAPPANE